MVYISAFDMIKKGKIIYRCMTVDVITGTSIDNELKEIYVNTAVNDGTTIAELMACFLQEQVNNKKFPLLSARVGCFKNDEGGRKIMCILLDDYANEIAGKRDIANIRNMFISNGSLELAIATFRNVSEEIIRKVYEEVIGVKHKHKGESLTKNEIRNKLKSRDQP